MIVVNKRTHRPTGKDLYIGRPSEWGNPFSINEYTRADVIQLYRQHLWQLIQADRTWIDKLQALDQYDYLVCWCKPADCHGDVIVRAHEWAIVQK